MLKGKQLFDFVHSGLSVLGKNFSGLWMVELGSQGMSVPGIKYSVAKDYFKALGFEHLSIDMDGLHGSVQLDLTRKLTQFYGQFDVVTNFGTSEHVHDQFTCFENIHWFCKTGGIMIHSVPLPGHWPMHCEFHYPEKFFIQLAKKCYYEICRKQVISMSGGPASMIGKRGLACVVLKKQFSTAFIKIDEFNKFPIVKEDYLRNHNNLR